MHALRFSVLSSLSVVLVTAMKPFLDAVRFYMPPHQNYLEDKAA